MEKITFNLQIYFTIKNGFVNTKMKKFFKKKENFSKKMGNTNKRAVKVPLTC